MAKRGASGGATKRRAAPRKTAPIPALEVAAALAREGPHPCYLLLGADDYLRRAALDALRHALLGDNPGPACWDLDGAKASLAGVLDELRTLPFLGTTHRLVVVHDAAPFVGVAGEDLAAFLASPTSSSTLALTASKLDGRFKSTKVLEAAARVISCAPFDEAGLRGFLRQRAGAHGRTLAPGAAELLLERLGGQDVALDTIDAEVQKLVAGAGEGPITPALVEELASFGSSEQSFALIELIARGDVEGAQLCLRTYLRDGLVSGGGARTREPAGIAMILLPTLRWDLNRLIRARTLLDAGVSADEALRSARVFGRDKQQFLARARRGDRAELARRHALLRAADRALRTSAAPVGVLGDVVLKLTLAERGPVAAGAARRPR